MFNKPTNLHKTQPAILSSVGIPAAYNGSNWKAFKIWNHLIFFCKSAAEQSMYPTERFGAGSSSAFYSLIHMHI